MKQVVHNHINQKRFVLQRGQALLTLLVFMVIVITISSGAVAVILINSLSATKYEQSQRSYSVAESGVEDVMVQLLRNPFYTGESLTIDDGVASVVVTGTGPYTIVSQGKVGNFIRTVQVNVGYTNNILTVNSWKEI